LPNKQRASPLSKMLFWTHFYDLICKLISILIAVALALGIALPLHFSSHVTGLCVGGSVVVFGLPIYVYGLRTLGSMLYCRFSLGARFSFSQARQLDRVLSPLVPLLWCDLREIKGVPESEKFSEALRLAEAWRHERQQFKADRDQRLGEQTGLFKLVRGSLMVLMLIGFGMGYLVIPPFDKLAELQASFGDDHKYSPLLNGLLGALLPGILVRILDARKGIHSHHVDKN
jgi:hypothetical protein